MSRADFLVELGTEELPPKALRDLMDAFGRELTAGLDDARLEHSGVKAYASPRRLAVLVESLADAQPAREVEQKGPPVRIAFDADGKPQPPAVAFAKKCGTEVGALERTPIHGDALAAGDGGQGVQVFLELGFSSGEGEAGHAS